ncbi:MAG: hypothetical protein AB1758_34790, partial [Candidatus Eremiobacterota bacterium]
GYETITVTRPGVATAWTRLKNQAERLYVSSHGSKSGELIIQCSTGLCSYPAPQTVGEHWKDNLRVVIVAGCSVFNIGNLNDWPSYKHLSPGKAWKDATNPNCVLLGYNATAPGVQLTEAYGAGHIDTRILERYHQYLPRQIELYGDNNEARAMAWLVANAAMEHRQSDDACAITSSNYYFIKFRSWRGKERLTDPHYIPELGNRNDDRAIYRVPRSLWDLDGEAAFKAERDKPNSAIRLMRVLGEAWAGQSEQIGPEPGPGGQP